MNRFLEQKNALVVGGSGGIGSAVSLHLAAAGASVCIHGGTNRSRLDRTVEKARSYDSEVSGVLQKLTTASDADALLLAAGSVDILIVSFGPYMVAPLHETTPEQWSSLVELNLLLPARLIHGVLDRMREQSYGRIILFGGPRADRPQGYTTIAAYAAVKAGVTSLTRSLARQYASDNIRCNMISPGYVATEYISPQEQSRLAADRPTGRLVSINQIADLCISLLKPESDAINGAIIPIDYGE